YAGMRESPLKTAVLGLDDAGRLLLEAAQGLDYFTIVAVADSDTNLAQQQAGLCNCAAYDDYRQLITQNQLDCLFVAAPLHSCAEYLRMALKKKFNILKLPPLARNFSEAAELVKLAQDQEISLAVANLGRFAKPALAMRSFVLQNSAEQPFFILAAASGGPRAKWRNDPVLAGGGVVLYDCWDIIDQITWNFGIPQQVYCPVLSAVEGVAGITAPDRQQRLYLTEDSAIVTMKFSAYLSGCLLAGRAAPHPFWEPGLSKLMTAASQNGCGGKGPQKWLITHGLDKRVRFDDKSFEVTDSLGQCLQQDNFDDDCLSRMKKVLENFGSNLLWPDKDPLISTAADNLKNMAVIEAAYLSARTGMPEEPGKILKIA
ncbi:MAG: Gfo/Idh/MocA family oxidoreductase, partial [Sedimentisphaerales bacterium]|nr:Gfo/Idh/MocA family oxidoreductase [Sedimentisphaerales bacterium]